MSAWLWWQLIVAVLTSSLCLLFVIRRWQAKKGWRP
jgi:hypothetical protein